MILLLVDLLDYFSITNKQSKIKRHKSMIKSILLLAVLSFTANAGTAYLKHQYVSGMNRVCVYNNLGSDYAITIKLTEICPLNINV
jgi:hypothetical protein